MEKGDNLSPQKAGDRYNKSLKIFYKATERKRK